MYFIYLSLDDFFHIINECHSTASIRTNSDTCKLFRYYYGWRSPSLCDIPPDMLLYAIQAVHFIP